MRKRRRQRDEKMDMMGEFHVERRTAQEERSMGRGNDTGNETDIGSEVRGKTNKGRATEETRKRKGAKRKKIGKMRE